MVGSHFILCARSFITVVMHTRIFLLLVSGFLSFVAAEQGYEMLAQVRLGLLTALLKLFFRHLKLLILSYVMKEPQLSLF